MSDMKKLDIIADEVAFECQILWSKKLNPATVERLLNGEVIQELLKLKNLPLVLDCFHKYGSMDSLNTIGVIYNIYINKYGQYIARFVVPDIYIVKYNCVLDPVIHPSVIGDVNYPETCRIGCFVLYDRSSLDKNNVYDGIHFARIVSESLDAFDRKMMTEQYIFHEESEE